MTTKPPAIQEGDRATVVRTFSVEEVRAFAELSGDVGVQHLAPDAQGRLMVHGLLVASLPTKVGGEMNFLARELTFEFLRPAWTSVPIQCEVVVTRIEPTEHGIRLESAWECKDPDGAVLMRGRGRGLVPKVGTRAGRP